MGAIITHIQSINKKREEIIRNRRNSGILLISQVLEEEDNSFDDIGDTNNIQQGKEIKEGSPKKHKRTTLTGHILPCAPRNRSGNPTFFKSDSPR